MQATFARVAATPSSISKAELRTGLALSAVPVLFLVFDGVLKFTGIPPVVESFERLGYAPSQAPLIGTIELTCLALYLWPRTSVLGAVLLTGFLGGAIATHVRLGDPLFSHTFFPLYVASLLWAGLALRKAPVREAFVALLRGTR